MRSERRMKMKRMEKEIFNLLHKGYRKDKIIAMVKNDPGYYGYENDNDLLETINACGRLIFTNWE
jgi:hypothetical protein